MIKLATKQKQPKKAGSKKPAKITKSVILPHKCPSCGTTAKTVEQDNKIFGTRKMKNPKTGQVTERTQSYCRKCRTKDQQAKNILRHKNPKLEDVDLRTVDLKEALGKKNPSNKVKVSK